MTNLPKPVYTAFKKEWHKYSSSNPKIKSLTLVQSGCGRQWRVRKDTPPSEIGEIPEMPDYGNTNSGQPRKIYTFIKVKKGWNVHEKGSSSPVEKVYSFFGPSRKEKTLTKKINTMKSRLGTGLGNESISFVDKIRSLTKERDSLRASFFNDEDTYMAGSPGMSSVGAIGGNTNKGLKPLPKGFDKLNLDKIKAKLKDKDNFHCHVNDYYSSSNNKIISYNWFTESSPASKVFKNTPPKGLAEKVRQHLKNNKK